MSTGLGNMLVTMSYLPMPGLLDWAACIVKTTRLAQLHGA